jgi:hypothetical protein
MRKTTFGGAGVAVLAVLFAFGAAKSDKAPPSVSILSPLAGTLVSGLVDVRLSTNDNVTAVRVVVLADGVQVCDLRNTGTPKSKMWSCLWDSRLPTEQLRTITATAYDAAGNNRSASIELTSAALLRIVTEILPEATCGQPYQAGIQFAGGIKPYAWSVTEGAVPAWLTITSQEDGLLLVGTPPAPGPDGTCGGPYLIAGLPLRMRTGQ